MADITASMVKELREMTGAGMMDCKKALAETDGDMQAAVDVLKKSGAAKAEKKAARIAAEGITRVAINDKKAVVVEVNAETDFVAKNEVFQEFVQSVADLALKSGLKGGKDGEDIDKLLETDNLKDTLVEKTATIGEKLSVRRFETIEADMVVSYLHGGGRIGVLVGAEGASSDAAKEALTNVAMQVAAMNPQYISKTDISEGERAKIREITIDSALNDPASLPKPILNALIEKALAGKLWSDEDVAIYEEKKSNMNYLFNFLSDAARAALAQLGLENKASYIEDKIFKGLVDGRIAKNEKEICLLEQVYVKAEDGKQTVAAYLKSVDPSIVIKKIVRFEVGEGMEKKNEDFAAEVAAQLG
ncbi:MAG: translation elongation factor Ts [Lachnospiraceae bacterium]|nr:translation elongation factor Ts [Lachnospiraceae bacterium]